MIKYLILVVLLCLFVQAGALEVLADTSGGSTIIYILVPFSDYLFPAQSNTAHYQLSLNLLNQDKKNVYQDIIDIMLNKEWLIAGAAQVFTINKKFTPGNYQMITMLKNLTLGDKRENQFNVFIPETGSSEIKNMIVAQNDNVIFSPASYAQLTPNLKSCDFILDTTVECDSIVLEITYPDKKLRKRISQNSGMTYDLLPYLSEGEISDLEVRYYTKNIIDSKGWLLYHSYDEFRQKYTLQDQIQQLRYIANQNDWKTIKQMADKDMDAAIEYFWEKHGNTPGTFKNNLRELFYERILKADEMFTIHKKLPGWKSDRGRIYIKMGPPDEIVSDPFPVGEYPYIIWYYYHQYRSYIFYDKRGFGDYKLEGYYED